MFICGTKSTRIIVEPLSEECLNCQTRHTMDLHIFQRYAHIFWIPLFPVGKYTVSQCNHCRQVLKDRQMPIALRAVCDKLRANAKTPVWTFAGIIIIALAIAIRYIF
jgi:uncharacterized membrane protein